LPPVAPWLPLGYPNLVFQIYENRSLAVNAKRELFKADVMAERASTLLMPITPWACQRIPHDREDAKIAKAVLIP